MGHFYEIEFHVFKICAISRNFSLFFSVAETFTFPLNTDEDDHDHGHNHGGHSHGGNGTEHEGKTEIELQRELERMEKLKDIQVSNL